MKTKTLVTFLLVLFVSGPISQYSFSQQPGEKPLAKEKWIRVELEAVVEAIDQETRKITLKGPRGNPATLTASEQIKRFDEIKVGDVVSAEYLTFLRAEFREPTAEEKAVPLVVLAEAGRAPKEVDPAGAVGAVVKAVVKVVAIDRTGRKATIQGPRGDFMIVPVMDNAVLNNLELGEVVIMTYAEAVALSLTKKVKE